VIYKCYSERNNSGKTPANTSDNYGTDGSGQDETISLWQAYTCVIQ
jgi:hypothetical protein